MYTRKLLAAVLILTLILATENISASSWAEVPDRFKFLGVQCPVLEGVEYVLIPAESQPFGYVPYPTGTPEEERSNYSFTAVKFAPRDELNSLDRIFLTISNGQRDVIFIDEDSQKITWNEGGRMGQGHYLLKDQDARIKEKISQLDPRNKGSFAPVPLKIKKVAKDLVVVTNDLGGSRVVHVPTGFDLELKRGKYLVVRDTKRGVLHYDGGFLIGSSDVDAVIIWAIDLDKKDSLISWNYETTNNCASGFQALNKFLAKLLVDTYSAEADQKIEVEYKNQRLYGKGWTRDGFLRLWSNTGRSSIWLNPTTSQIKPGFGWIQPIEVVSSDPIIIEDNGGTWKVTLVFNEREHQYTATKLLEE